MTRHDARPFSIIVMTVMLSLTGLALYSQTRITDSLRERVYSAVTESGKLQAMLDLCQEYQSLDRDTLSLYATQAVQLAKKSGDKKKISFSTIALANMYNRWGWMDSAVARIEPVIAGNSLKDPAERAIHFKAARQEAIFYGGKGKYSEALGVLYKLVSDAEFYNDTLTVSANMNTIGSIALVRESPTGALQWFARALAWLTPDRKFDAVRAAIYVNMGEGYYGKGQLDSAVWFGEQGARVFREQQNLGSLAIALQRQSSVYLKKGELSKAEAALKEMIAMRNSTKDGNLWVDDNLSLIDFYIATRQFDKAVAYCRTLIVTGNLYGEKDRLLSNSLSVRLPYYGALAKVYKAKGDDLAYQDMLEKIILAKDSFFTASSEQAIAEVQTKYEVQKKENRIIQQDLTIAQKNNLLLIMVGSGVLLGLVAFVLFRHYRRRQREAGKKAVADAEEKERKRIAADLHDNLGAYAASITGNLDVLRAGVAVGSRDGEEAAAASHAAMQELHNNSHSMVAQLSDTIWALNKDSLSLTALSDRIKIFLQRIRQSYPGIEMEVRERIIEDIELQPTQAFHLFQVVQEAVTNAVKHSGARQIVVEVEGENGWQVAVIDDGRGIKPPEAVSAAGNGLNNMRQRAAAAGWRIGWDTNQPSGTKVSIGWANKI